MPRAKNAFRFVKERLRAIQSETPFDRFPKRFTIEIFKLVVVLINLFRGKLGVYPVMSPRQILLDRKFKTPSCKIGKLVTVYDVTANNKTTISRAFYALYIGPNHSSTGHQVSKLLLKRLVTTPKCKPIPMPDNVIQVVNDMGEQDGMLNGIEFCNIHHESTLADLFVDNHLHDDNGCVSNNDWGLS